MGLCDLGEVTLMTLITFKLSGFFVGWILVDNWLQCVVMTKPRTANVVGAAGASECRGQPISYSPPPSPLPLPSPPSLNLENLLIDLYSEPWGTLGKWLLFEVDGVNS